MINKKFAGLVVLALLLSGCANKEAALGVQVSKKVDDEKLESSAENPLLNISCTAASIRKTAATNSKSAWLLQA